MLKQQADAAAGGNRPDAVGVSQQTFYRWKKQYVGLKSTRFDSRSMVMIAEAVVADFIPRYAGVGRCSYRTNSARSVVVDTRTISVGSAGAARMQVAWDESGSYVPISQSPGSSDVGVTYAHS